MIQIINRIEGSKTEKETITGHSVQVSFNSWGHIAIRVIQTEEADTLVVLDQKASREMIKFIQSSLKTEDLPF